MISPVRSLRHCYSDHVVRKWRQGMKREDALIWGSWLNPPPLLPTLLSTITWASCISCQSFSIQETHISVTTLSLPYIPLHYHSQTAVAVLSRNSWKEEKGNPLQLMRSTAQSLFTNGQRTGSIPCSLITFIAKETKWCYFKKRREAGNGNTFLCDYVMMSHRKWANGTFIRVDLCIHEKTVPQLFIQFFSFIELLRERAKILTLEKTHSKE